MSSLDVITRVVGWDYGDFRTLDFTRVTRVLALLFHICRDFGSALSSVVCNERLAFGLAVA